MNIPSLNTAIPQTSVPQGMIVPNQFPPYANQTIFYPPRAKLELSKFNGNEKQGVAWFNKVEEYFDIYGISIDDEKLWYASMQLEGNAYNWYMWWKKTGYAISWTKFKNDFF